MRRGKSKTKIKEGDMMDSRVIMIMSDNDKETDRQLIFGSLMDIVNVMYIVIM